VDRCMDYLMNNLFSEPNDSHSHSHNHRHSRDSRGCPGALDVRVDERHGTYFRLRIAGDRYPRGVSTSTSSRSTSSALATAPADANNERDGYLAKSLDLADVFRHFEENKSFLDISEYSVS
jgi:hypothetical protein